VQGVSWPQWAASNDAAPRSEMPCAANDSGEWRRYTSDFGLNQREGISHPVSFQTARQYLPKIKFSHHVHGKKQYFSD
jgi:hypothetical protein